MAILVTGGTGFIGSHVVVLLLKKGYHVIIIDNFCNSELSMITKINELSGTGTEETNLLTLVYGDIRDSQTLNKLFETYTIEIVLHFAALKSVSESEKYPELYHDVNVDGTLKLLETMKKHNCHNLVYSSSATVYGNSVSPVTENSITGSYLGCNYAKNKYDVEEILRTSYSNWNIIILRYFNPIGAHPSGKIGENPKGIPNNIFPYLLRVAKYVNGIDKNIDKTSPYNFFTIFGNDYGTRDGTCIRDYIHVQDLARAHVEVLKVIEQNRQTVSIYNVGTGRGTTVLELIQCLNDILESKGYQKIPVKVGDKRVGDIVVSYSNVDKIYNDIQFKTELPIKDMCRDGLNFIGL